MSYKYEGDIGLSQIIKDVKRKLYNDFIQDLEKPTLGLEGLIEKYKKKKEKL